jgi:hypothetical protein
LGVAVIIGSAAVLVGSTLEAPPSADDKRIFFVIGCWPVGRCPFSNRRDLAIFSEQAKGDGEMKGWKWAGKLRVQICIIVVLVFIIWIVLQKQYY